MTPDFLLAELRARVTPAHHIPGRLRLRFAGGLPAGVAPDALQHALTGLPGVRELTINLLARSCTIHYDAKTLPPRVWDDLFAGRRGPAVDDLLDALCRGLHPQGTAR